MYCPPPPKIISVREKISTTKAEVFKVLSGDPQQQVGTSKDANGEAPPQTRLIQKLWPQGQATSFHKPSRYFCCRLKLKNCTKNAKLKHLTGMMMLRNRYFMIQMFH